jgi:transposase
MVRSLERDSLLLDRVERLMAIPAAGPITALTWALEVADVQRFSSIKKAVSYCGPCGAEKSSANTVQRMRIGEREAAGQLAQNKSFRRPQENLPPAFADCTGSLPFVDEAARRIGSDIRGVGQFFVGHL